MDAADGQLVVGVVVWPFGMELLDVEFKQGDQISLLLLFARLNNRQVQIFRIFGRRCPWRFHCQCGRHRRAVEKVVVVMRRMTADVETVARCRVYYIHVLTKDSAVTVRSCTSMVLVILGSVCSAVAMGGGRPLGSFD